MTVATSTVAQPAAAGSALQKSHRLATIDIVRGVVMLLMAIDHVRVYSGVPAGGPTPGVFFTRWITHFVAPSFIFLAGTSAFLHGRRLASRGQLARFLVTRGAWLILLEMTVLRVAWTFNVDFGNYLLAGVIWVIGWCMILLAPLVFLPVAAVGAFGVLLIVGHNLMDFAPALQSSLGEGAGAWFWQLLYLGGVIQLGEGGPPLAVLYSIVPWIGVIAAGYAFGSVMTWPAGRRRSFCLRIGAVATIAFVLLRALDAYGDPRNWRIPPRPTAQTTITTAPAATTVATRADQAPQQARRAPPPAVLRFLGTTKYPASLLFLLMTLGPMVLALGLLESARGSVANVLAVFGRVPLFYYLLHIPLIHTAALIVSLLRTGALNPWLFDNHPMFMPPAPPGYMWSLPLLYLVTAIVIVLLYFPCRWFAELKSRSQRAWLSYL